MITRIHLLQSQNVARFFLRDGSQVDALLSAITAQDYEPGQTCLNITANNETYRLFLNRGNQVSLEMIYAMTRPEVARIDSKEVSHMAESA